MGIFHKDLLPLHTLDVGVPTLSITLDNEQIY